MNKYLLFLLQFIIPAITVILSAVTKEDKLAYLGISIGIFATVINFKENQDRRYGVKRT